MVEEKNHSALEVTNNLLANEVAKEGIVLLKNNGALPLKCKKIALYGVGARKTCKGGTGSGEVNNRHNISIDEGLKLCNIKVTTENWLDDYDEEFIKAEKERDAKIKAIGKKYRILNFWALLEELSFPFIFPEGRDINLNDVKNSQTDTAIYVLSRQAGEGCDRHPIKGEYYPSDQDIKNIDFLSKHYKNTILVINSGSCVEVNELLKYDLSAIIFMGQAGQSGGLALAELLIGKDNFSGKLAATWPKHLSDLPCSDSFSFLDNNLEREIYKDGIYVGYRFFDSFNIKPEYEFGFGLSYTKFDISAKAHLDGKKVIIDAYVKNIGQIKGKEVVQVYISCPGKNITREYQQLATFFKTNNIQPGKKQVIRTDFDITDFTYYDETNSQFVLEKGNYYIRVGNSSRNTKIIATIVLNKDYVIEKCKQVVSKPVDFEEIKPVSIFGTDDIIGDQLEFNVDIKTIYHTYKLPIEEVLPGVKTLCDEDLVALCVGDPVIMKGGIADVVGATGQINRKVCHKLNYKSPVMADGPAGLRIAKEYYIEPNGKIKLKGIIPENLIKAKRIFALVEKLLSHKSKKAKVQYQYCTAWPSATVQAQTFSLNLIQNIGHAIAKEMKKFGISIWLAPGMNIQRFPLCGRNYEYYSEDPILTANMAIAINNGVQAEKNCAVTIKHFCCNNQENNRMKNSSEINERALREIYLKAFKIAIKNSHPICLMSSYNKLNGKYVNSSYELITNVLRNEFGFDGVIMTDWQTVAPNQAKADDVLSSENDLIMAGDKYQYQELLRALKSGKIKRLTLERSATRILLMCEKLNKSKEL